MGEGFFFFVFYAFVLQHGKLNVHTAYTIHAVYMNGEQKNVKLSATLPACLHQRVERRALFYNPANRAGYVARFARAFIRFFD